MSDIQNMQAHAMMLARVLLTAMSDDDLTLLLNEYDRMDTLMPMIDPTAYKRVGRNIPGYRRVVAALAAARREIAAVLAEEAENE
jgi:hypothetical protein